MKNLKIQIIFTWWYLKSSTSNFSAQFLLINILEFAHDSRILENTFAIKKNLLGECAFFFIVWNVLQLSFYGSGQN